MGGRPSREKGKRGEREVAALIRELLGVDAQRRVRQHDGDSDVVGVDGWSIEVKNCATLNLSAWWDQTIDQLARSDYPALFYKVPRKGWRVRMPLHAAVMADAASMSQYDLQPELAIDVHPQAWAAVAKRIGA